MRKRLGAAAKLMRRNRHLRRYTAARTAFVLGTTTAPAGLAFALLAEDGAAATLGLVTTIGLLAYLAVTPIAGVLADRLPRHCIIVASQLVCGLSQGLSGALVINGSATTWSLGGLAMLTAAAAAFFQPAAKGMLAALVTLDALVPANALLQIAASLAAIIGPATAGLVIALGSPGWILAWTGAAHLLSGAMFLTVRRPDAHTPDQRHGIGRELLEGLSAFANRRWLRVLTSLHALTSACWSAGFTVLGPLFALRHLEDGALSWGIIGSAFGAGLIIGSVTALLLPPSRMGMLLCAAALPEALLLASMAAAAPTWWIAIASALAGAAATLKLVSYTSLQQREIPHGQLSRVTATASTVGSALAPVFSALAGPLADAVGVRLVLAGCAAIAVTGAAAAFSVRDVRHLGAPASPDFSREGQARLVMDSVPVR
ncbi:MFS transporter [Nonomuraea sp. NPDC050202]|jgi:MFS family permease|uniref:MFS transporter n=1 Tax=Nonomuraea sp. NPDC050202 TaxID=3155035 RepID=UPI0033D13DAE